MKTKLWLVSTGNYFQESYPIFACHTKKNAFAICRKDGFRYNKRDEIFEKDSSSAYRTVEPLEIKTS